MCCSPNNGRFFVEPQQEKQGKEGKQGKQGRRAEQAASEGVGGVGGEQREGEGATPHATSATSAASVGASECAAAPAFLWSAAVVPLPRGAIGSKSTGGKGPDSGRGGGGGETTEEGLGGGGGAAGVAAAAASPRACVALLWVVDYEGQEEADLNSAIQESSTVAELEANMSTSINHAFVCCVKHTRIIYAGCTTAPCYHAPSQH